MRLRWLLFTLCAALLASPARAVLVETPKFEVLGSAEGLPSDTVYALAQDRDGRLWVGTGDGLARWDGVEFVVYRHRPEAADSLPSNVVQALHVDAAGRVWVGSEGGGLSMLAPGAAGFRHYRRGAPAAMALDDVWSITSTADGAIWFGGFGGGLYRLDPADDALRAFRHDRDDPHSLSSDHVLALAADAAGNLWVAGSAGLDRHVDGRFERHPPGAGGPRAGLIFSLTADADGGLWIGTAAGLDHRSPDGRITAAPQGAGLGEPGVTALVRDAADSVWMATRSGLHHWQDGQLRHYPSPSARQAGREPVSLLDLLRDHEGGLWFASVGGGLLRLPPNWRDFSTLQADPDRADALGTSAPRGIADAGDGRLWVVGRGGGLNRVDPRDGRVERLLGGDAELPDRRLHSVLQGSDGAVWIGHQLGISRFEPATGALRHWLGGSADDAPPAGPVDLLLADRAGGFWLSAYGGGIERRAVDGRLLERFLPGDAGGLPSADVEQIAIGPDGALWIAGSFGLARRAAAGGAIEPVAGAPALRITSFDFAADGSLWTHRLGALEQFSLAAGGVALRQRVDAAQGLPAVASGSLLHDRAGALWLTSRRGLLRYRPVQRDVREFGVRDGLHNHEFSDRPALRRTDGSIAAGTLDGLLLFDPTALHQSAAPPRLRLHAASVLRDGQRIALDPAQPLALRHDDRELQLVSRLTAFSAPAAHRFRYRLEGFDDDWVDSAAFGERVYSRLPPGDFLLHVVGAVDGSAAPSPPLQLAVSVSPPWWQTLEARLLQGAALLLVLFAGWRLWRRRAAQRLATQLAERERQWALQASQAKTRFLATLGHEIRTPMTGVLGMTELLLGSALAERQRAHAEAIQRSGQLMLRLLNDALDLARIEAGALPLDDVVFDLRRCLQDIAAQQQPLAEARGLGFRFEIDPGVPRWRRGDPQRLQQVLLNLLGNAIKFTEHGHVALSLCGSDDGFELQVSDSGPGLNAAQCERLFRRFERIDDSHGARSAGGSGLGLAISQELVAAMGGRIVVDSRPGVGSCFRVQLALPIVDPQLTDADADRPALATPLDAETPQPQLLLVEDDAVVAEVIAELLAAHGFRVRHAAHGLAALGELAAHRFDAVICDLDLPGIDGLALVRLLRAQQQRLPMLALTARADPAAEPEALAAGFDAFLRKPVGGTALAQALRSLCGSAAAATLEE